MSDDEYKLSRNSFFLFSCLWVSEMADASEDGWKETMIELFQDLKPAQFKKMVEILKADDPTFDMLKNSKIHKKSLAKKIVEKYGLEEAISRIDRAMEEIPGIGQEIQKLLEKLRNIQEDEQRGEFTQSGLVCGGSQLITCS